MKRSPQTSGKRSIWPAWLSVKTANWSLVVLTVLLYGNTLGHGFTLDDAIVIYDNEYTQKGFAGIPDLWSYDSFRGFFKEAGKEGLVAGGRYRPLTLTQFAIEYQLFGRSPLAGHLFNLFWYSLLILVLFNWLKWQSEDKWPWQLAWLIALLFMAHPVHVEVVANIKGRDEILCLLLCLGSARYLFSRAWLSAVFLFFAFTAKEMALSALLWIPLAYVVFGKWTLKGSLRKSWPLLAAFAAYMLIRVAVLGASAGSGPSMELMNNPFLKWNGSTMVAYTLSERIASVLTIFSEYIRLLVFPVNLNHDYYPAALPVGSWADPRTWFGLLTLLSLAFLAFRSLKRPSVYGWTATGYLVGFALIGNVFFPIGTFMGERFLFMPSLFFIIAIATYFHEKWSTRILLLGALIFALYAFRTVIRNPVWESDERLFLNDVKHQPESAKLRNAAAGAILTSVAKLPDPSSAGRQIETAITHLEKALSIHPLYKNAWLQMGNARYYQGAFSAAEESYLKALDIDPGYDLARTNLAIAYRDHGKQLGEKEGNIPAAIAVLKQSLEYRQDDPETYRLLGVAYGFNGQLTEARASFEKVVGMSPENADGWYNLGVALMQMGETDDGQKAMQKARELDPVRYK